VSDAARRNGTIIVKHNIASFAGLSIWAAGDRIGFRGEVIFGLAAEFDRQHGEENLKRKSMPASA
jgi:hypothetical protein